VIRLLLMGIVGAGPDHFQWQITSASIVAIAGNGGFLFLAKP